MRSFKLDSAELFFSANHMSFREIHIIEIGFRGLFQAPMSKTLSRVEELERRYVTWKLLGSLDNGMSEMYGRCTKAKNEGSGK